MDFDTEKFITEVFARPVVWNQKHKDYHNRVIVENNWKAIEAAMKQPKELLKKKWKCLRDQFRCECKKIPVPQPGDPDITHDQLVTYTIWPYFKSLSFLKDQMQARKSLIASSQSLSEEMPNSGKVDATFNTEEYLDSQGEEASVVPKKKRSKTNTNQTDLLAIERKKLELLEKKVNNQMERNDDEDFFNSLIPFMKKMDLNQKMLCRMEIQQVVYNHSYPNPTNTVPVTQCPSDYRSTSEVNITSVYTTTDNYNSVNTAGASTSTVYKSENLEFASID